MGKHPLNLALRFFLELTALAVFAIWGWNWGTGWWRTLPAIIIPLIFAVLWAVFAVKDDPSRSGKTVVNTPGVFRLFLELAFFGLATLALFDLDWKTPGIVFAIVVIMHFAISYDRVIWLLNH